MPARRLLICAVAAMAIAASPGCLVVSLHPAYDDDSIVDAPGLAGTWRDDDDKSTLRIETSEWHSYKLHYEHPSEKGDLTGYVTAIGEARYLDVSPARGEDRGSFVMPLHMVLRLTLDGDTLTLTPLSYDVPVDRLRAGRGAPPGLAAVIDEKQNVLMTSPTARLRTWLSTIPPGSPFWGAPATFTRQANQ
jgi:hypothetical protein